MSLTERVLHFARTLAGVPNVPFLHAPVLHAMLHQLKLLGIGPQMGTSRDGACYTLDDWGLYVRIRRGSAPRPIVIDSHLDHPGFALDGHGRAIPFGSIGLERISRLLQRGPLDLRIFDPRGNFLTMGQITALQLGGKPLAQVVTTQAIPPNSHGLWNVPDFEQQGEELLMYAADNQIVTAVMLALIEALVQNAAHTPDVDVLFVFTFLEEVFQISATGLALQRRKPFGALDQRSLVIALEAMECVPLPGHASLYSTFGLPQPHPEQGLMIKVNDRDCVYGYAFPDQPNLAEIAVLHSADACAVAYQHTLFGGVCDATSFSVFPSSSHIVTLAVPNPYKHNDDAGELVPERVKLADVAAVAQVLLHLLAAAGQEPPATHARALSPQLKCTALRPDAAAAARLRAERSTIAWSAQQRLRKMRYFGANALEQAQFSLRGGLARVRAMALQRVLR